MQRIFKKIKADIDNNFICCDRIILCCLCFMIFCLPFAKAGTEGFAWLAILVWILKRVFGYRAETLAGIFPKTELNKAVGMLIAVSALSMIFSTDIGLSLRGFFGKQLKFVAIYFMVIEVVKTRVRLKYVLTSIIACAVLLTIDAGFQYFHGTDFLRGEPFGGSLKVSFVSGNGFAIWLIVVIPILIGALTKYKEMNAKIKILLFALIPLLMICLIGTYSRGGWVGFITACCLMIYYIFRQLSPNAKRWFLIVGACLLAAYLFFPKVIKTAFEDISKINLSKGLTIGMRFDSIFDQESSVNTHRARLWTEALKITKDYPFVGCGLNTYAKVAPRYKISEQDGIYAHNSYLQMAAETGLLGLFAFFWVLFMLFRTGLQHLYRRKCALVLGFLVGLLAFLVHAFFDNHLYALQFVVLFWFMLGLTVAAIRVDRGEPESEARVKQPEGFPW